MRLAGALIAVLGSLTGPLALASGTTHRCLRSAPVPVLVGIEGRSHVAAVLQGGIEIPLRLIDQATGRTLWSASGGSSTSQRFAGMDAAILGSLTAIDLDGDGRHDRLYAGDLSGRLWRIDLHHGAPASRWATAGVFADFANSEGRGFLAAPDLALSRPPGAEPWLNIALGTAAPGNEAASNRFYVLRDVAFHEQWTQQQFDDWRPLREADLLHVAPIIEAVGSPPSPPDAQGWFITLGRGHVVTPSITVNHKVVMAIATALPDPGSCEVFARIVTLDPLAQRVQPGPTLRDWSTPLDRPFDMNAAFTLLNAAGSTAVCSLGGQAVAACTPDLRPRRTWWRRSDAE